MELNQWQLHYPFAEQASLRFEREKKSIYCWTRSRPTWTFGESDDQVRDKSESKYQRVQDKSETIEKRLESGLESGTGLEYYSPNCWPSGKYVHLLYMYSILGKGSFRFNYCLNSAWHGADQFVALLRWYGSPGFFDSSLQLICIFWSLVSHFPLDNTQ